MFTQLQKYVMELQCDSTIYYEIRTNKKVSMEFEQIEKRDYAVMVAASTEQRRRKQEIRYFC